MASGDSGLEGQSPSVKTWKGFIDTIGIHEFHVGPANKSKFLEAKAQLIVEHPLSPPQSFR